jgi:NADH-ubiquinone oxidoreductase chain 5
MIFSCGLSSYEVGVFHLSNHAFFKALLFLGAGSVIHAVNDEQDMRKLGGLQKLLPFSYAIMLIGSLALMGFPFLTGFYSKDIILEIAYAKFTFLSHFAYTLGTLAAFCTAFYSIRLLFLVFLAEPNGNREIIVNAHEGSWRIGLPLFLLSFFSISIGYLTHDFFIGFGTHFWNDSIFISISNYSLVDIEFVNLFYKLLPLFVTILGSLFAYFIYSFNLNNYFLLKKTKIFKKFYNFFNKKWYFDRIYNEIITQKFLDISYIHTYKNIDRGILEIFGPSGIINIIQANTKSIVSLQSGYISHYLFMFFISILLIFLFIFSFFTLYSFNLIFFFLIYFIID